MAQGRNQAKAAEAAGVARSSVLRWLTTQEFKDLVEEERARLELEEHPQTLESLVPDAHKLLQDAMKNDGTVSAARANIALAILKAAEVTERANGMAGASSLASRLAELADQGTSD